jgi:hypothetical protein
MKIAVFCFFAPCSLVEIHGCSKLFAGSIIREMGHEAINASEPSVKFFQTTLFNNPEGNYFHTCRRENLKSHLSPLVFAIFFKKRSNFVKPEMGS